LQKKDYALLEKAFVSVIVDSIFPYCMERRGISMALHKRLAKVVLPAVIL
jgi:hypothetical protein